MSVLRAMSAAERRSARLLALLRAAAVEPQLVQRFEQPQAV
jgi:hypothetical protein